VTEYLEEDFETRIDAGEGDDLEHMEDYNKKWIRNTRMTFNVGPARTLEVCRAGAGEQKRVACSGMRLRQLSTVHCFTVHRRPWMECSAPPVAFTVPHPVRHQCSPRC
jgi:hypothetical protein